MSQSGKKEIRLNAFNMNCVSHINHGLWTHPRDRSQDYTDVNYWTDLAKLLERGKFDGLFLADIVGVYDVYQNAVDLTLRETIQLPVNDPLLLVSAMGHVTEHLGFGVTVNLTYEAPFLFARRMSTLDHLTKGRIGWNIVTGYLDSAARAMGLSEQIAHDERYDRADEFLEVVYKLWEGSWEEQAVLRDRARRIYAQPDKVHTISHHGKYYDVDGIHLSEPSRQRTPVLYQAGSSGRGQQFAARHAECIFISGQTREAVRKLVIGVREGVVREGRHPDDIKVFMGITVIVAPTTKEAQEKYQEYKRYASPEAGLAHFSSGTGIDFSKYELDEPIRQVKTNSIESLVKTVTNPELNWTKRKLLRQLELGGRYLTIVGSPQEVADELEGWIRETDIDGFNLTRTVTPESYEDFIDLVIPELQTRGSYKHDYAPGSLREKLFHGDAYLPSRHIGATYRTVSSVDQNRRHA
ncbi:FMN-dependent oxidoreductase (nitrilotriacetate monooxygenase family) [Herbaspirillum sp. Sphag1AN]|uniref:LLM class flavin-dependent oxidoreductase n=1 Tax=unclassified Herbaspirillum TaxID=2624150 RepID=UPI0016175454|nr:MULTISPECIES: LLM class flavin-dependent oxidoreductase [unclassified Herbaspirillum]MBB3214499.1 FMN-dependent oxidoreductase (nitrilotriacetate monooxygenase family) [Herbaspirillum sp. Sphag1AN]MBB3247661.1 FMN-dependent oxidoreductase (nitrilotriacetate monooxygenase family) [Herbaspirillum sp. Sphag64]